MNTNPIVVGLVALVIGLGGGYLIANNNQQAPTGHMMADGSMMQNGMGSAMDDMMAGLKGKTGDEFDRAFLSEMIMHHQGAVQMAQAALQDAKHQEIKDMAKAIISAQ
ncbi:DUF305 domain-containing protein, partial [Patescibacteria group bacterium]|nr:DUF305 domain-containing protein [Patescibacteria group bacterium]